MIRVTGLKKSFPKGKEFSQGERGFTRVEGYRYGDPAGRGDRLPWK